MHSKKLKTHLSIIALVAILYCESKIYSQTSPENSIYNWFDTIVGKENLGINNGTLHVNPYNTVDKNNNYYDSNKFSLGDVNYDGQFYYDVDLKYDIHRDILVLKPYGDYNPMGLNLIQEKTASFSINGKTFVNLSYIESSLPEYIHGYYEVNLTEKNLILYVKHHKDRKKIIKYEAIYDEFDENNEFILSYKNTFYKINSKNDITKIFPKYKNKISDYFVINGETEKKDKIQFMRSLIQFINNFLLDESN